MSDAAPPPLLPRVAAGDAAAVEVCLERYASPVWGLALRYLARRADAEDAVQEIFLDLWRHAGRYDPAVAAESTFVMTVARRRLIDRRRRLAARPEASAPPPDRPDAAPAVPEAVAAADDAARARRELAALPDGQRRVIELAVNDGLSQSEIAAATGLPLGTVKSHARRGLRRLRDRLSAPPPPSPNSSPTAAPAARTREGVR